MGTMKRDMEHAPVPTSDLIGWLVWDDDVVRLGGERAGDNWPITWGTADLVYTAYGDGNGFGPRERCYTLAFATLTGHPPQLHADDLATDLDVAVGWGKDGIKASGLLMVDDALYLFVRNYVVGGDWRHSRLAVSRDYGLSWTWAPWHFAESFGCPEFVQFGSNYADSRDSYVYIVSQDGSSAYDFDTDVVMARVPAPQLMQREAYQFFAGLNSLGEPLWDADIRKRAPVFSDPAGTQRVGLTHNRGLGRYLLTTAHSTGTGATHTGALGVFDAPEPWGPWTTVGYEDRWSGGWMIHHKFPTPWMSEDGLSMWLAYSGEYKPGGEDYCLLLRRAEVVLNSTE